MLITQVHPYYTNMLAQWELGLHSYEGERIIKSKGIRYLPATSGQIADGALTSDSSIGGEAYKAYKLRAVYPGIYREAVEAAIGILHKEPPYIKLPKVLEPMRGNATLLNESLELVLRRIHTQQLITGRLGLLADLRNDGGMVRPVIALYNDIAVRNWDDTSIEYDDIDMRLVVLDESGYEIDSSLGWTYRYKYRILGFTDNDDGSLSERGTYGSALVREDGDIATTSLQIPNLQGNTLDRIPFVFVNSKDMSPTPDGPPMNSLAELCLTIYRGEADYRQHLFMQGQDTLVVVGSQIDESETVRTGAGARIDVPQGGDAKYIGIGGSGLGEQRQALENDYVKAARKSSQLLDSTSREKESGEALRIRVAAQTATLPQLAKTGAAALERILRKLAKWYGANPDEVKVEPNLNFPEKSLNAQTLVGIMQAKGLGAPISEESVHMWIQENGLSEYSYEEELEKIALEEPAPGQNMSSSIDEDDN
jgi:hypothetical protein